jgi:plasmid segregation protein ParM
MERYVAVDAGKFATKVAEYHKDKDETTKFKFATKMSEGNFLDDSLEKETYLVEIEGKVYKFGKGATGKGAALETDKNSDIHKYAILTALASMCSDNEPDVFNVATCIPVSEWMNVDKRIESKKYLLPEGDFTIKIRAYGENEYRTKRFSINQKTKLCLPESIGGMFLDEAPAISEVSNIGIIDIGSLNAHVTKWTGIIPDQDYCDTSELGGTILARTLASKLSATFSRCDENLVRKTLLLKPKNRHLYPNNGDEDIINRSKDLIDKALLEHVQSIKSLCDAKGWPLAFMDLRFVGGTSAILKNEIYQVFGENVYIAPNSAFCNAYGCLRSLCARIPSIGDVIPLPPIEKEEKEEEEEAA